MGFLILVVRWHLYIESAPWYLPFHPCHLAGSVLHQRSYRSWAVRLLMGESSLPCQPTHSYAACQPPCSSMTLGGCATTSWQTLIRNASKCHSWCRMRVVAPRRLRPHHAGSCVTWWLFWRPQSLCMWVAGGGSADAGEPYVQNLVSQFWWPGLRRALRCSIESGWVGHPRK